MKTRLFSRDEIEKYLARQEISFDLTNHETIGISSIADLLEICEGYKKGNHKGDFIGSARLFYSQIVDCGLVFVADVDQDTLRNSILDAKDEDELILWREICKDSLPMQTLRKLSMRVSTEMEWWDEQVFSEMKSIYD